MLRAGTGTKSQCRSVWCHDVPFTDVEGGPGLCVEPLWLDVRGDGPFLKDEVWFDAVRPYFAGNLIVGHDLLEI